MAQRIAPTFTRALKMGDEVAAGRDASSVIDAFDTLTRRLDSLEDSVRGIVNYLKFDALKPIRRNDDATVFHAGILDPSLNTVLELETSRHYTWRPTYVHMYVPDGLYYPGAATEIMAQALGLESDPRAPTVMTQRATDIADYLRTRFPNADLDALRKYVASYRSNSRSVGEPDRDQYPGLVSQDNNLVYAIFSDVLSQKFDIIACAYDMRGGDNLRVCIPKGHNITQVVVTAVATFRWLYGIDPGACITYQIFTPELDALEQAYLRDGSNNQEESAFDGGFDNPIFRKHPLPPASLCRRWFDWHNDEVAGAALL